MSQVLENVWVQVLDSAKSEIKPQTFDTWFKPLQPIRLDQSKLDIEVPNLFFKNWVQEHYQGYLEKLLETILSKPIALDIKIGKESIQKLDPTLPGRMPSRKSIPLNKSIFQTQYSFNEFVVGPCNRLAYAASIAVSKEPAKTYNPLFIYGGSGLGKTHLLHAIGLSVQEHFADKKVVYISCEEFTNQLINSIQNRNTIKFRNRYRTVDVLLIDDVHFLSGKEQTQEEFFHTFNALYNSGKQIILSSDKPPKAIKNLEDRLVSRFEWGLVSDMQIPGYETRSAILLRKAEKLKVDLPIEVAEFLSEHVRTNIRKLEGALVKLTSYASLTGKHISLETAKEVLKDFVANEKIVSIEEIQKRVAEHYDIRLADMTSKKRPKAIAFPRQVAMYLCKELTGLSLNEIGEAFGGRDHTTVLYGIQVITVKLKDDFSLLATVSTIRNKIRS